MAKNKKEQWLRTGVTDKEFSFNGKGIIHLAQEKNGKGWTRMVQIGYTSITPDEEREGDK